MVRSIKTMFAVLFAATLLASCGGSDGKPGCSVFSNCSGTGTGTGTGTGGTTTGNTVSPVADLRIVLSSSTVANQATKPVDITVTAVNSDNQTISGAAVKLTSADPSAQVTTSQSSTGTDGTLKGTVGVGTDTAPRTIAITATSGAISRTVNLVVIEGAATNTNSPSIAMSLSTRTVTSAAPAVVTITLRNVNGNAEPNAVVSFATAGGLGKLSASSALTDSNGTATVALFPVSSTTSGADTVVAEATVGGTKISTTQGFQINSTQVTIASFADDLAGGSLSAYGQANLTVKLGGTVAGAPVALSIDSTCVSSGKATITPMTTTTTNGAATFTYKDKQCGAADTKDTVQITITGSATQKSLTIPLTPPAASSLGFVTALPNVIYLKGSGLTETSIVTFVVKDQAGNPLPNQKVDVEPTTLTGGVTMDGGSAQVTKVSDSNGQITVRINSGTVPTPVRIKATLSGTNITTVSSNLSIAVGLPSELNFSLSQKTINIEGLDRDGTPNSYTIIASDRLGNPVPDGTAINFITEGGQIQSQSFTQMNAGLSNATASFQSSSPKPVDGRITILAYALGEESFLDANGNNVWDSSEPYQDLGNVFLSRAFSSIKHPVSNVDQYISTDINSASTCSTPAAAADPLGLLNKDRTIPSIPDTCDTTWSKKIYVRRATETVLSSSTSRLSWQRLAAGGVAAGQLPAGGVLSVNGGDNCQSFNIAVDGWVTEPTVRATETHYLLNGTQIWRAPVAGAFSFMVADANPNRLNPMPAGTNITVKATDGLSVSVSGGTPVANTAAWTRAAVTYKFSDTATNGTVFISTETPSGLITTSSVFLDRTPAPNPAPVACSL